MPIRARRYNKVRRAQAEAQTRERIIRATVELHAEHGTLGTSHAMIAERAGVSPQTVYNHFPTLGVLVDGCTSHVLSTAPAVDSSAFATGESPTARLRLLAAATHRQNAHLAPWLRLGWGEAESVPELQQLFVDREAELRELVRQAIAPEHRATREFLDAAMLLLSYPAWKGFRQRRSQAQAARLAGECLAALLHALSQNPPETQQ